MLTVFLLAFFGGMEAQSQLPGLSECTTFVNNQFFDPGSAAKWGGFVAHLDDKGSIQMVDPTKLLKRETKDGVEIFKYKNSQGSETTVRIQRDENRRILKVSKSQDEASQAEFNKTLVNNGLRPIPLVKSFDTEFSYERDNCVVNQTVRREQKSKGKQLDQIVQYDKKLCDQIQPLINQIGTQNAALCANLLGQTEMAVEKRQSDLAKEGKKLGAGFLFGGDGTERANAAGVYNLGSWITTCTTKGAFNGGGIWLGGNFPSALVGRSAPKTDDSPPSTDEVKLPPRGER